MLPRCADAGISVKYGRKVLQRLQAVGPARVALTEALAAADNTASLAELEAALGAAKSCRCLLDDQLLQVCVCVLYCVPACQEIIVCPCCRYAKAEGPGMWDV